MVLCTADINSCESFSPFDVLPLTLDGLQWLAAVDAASSLLVVERTLSVGSRLDVKDGAVWNEAGACIFYFMYRYTSRANPAHNLTRSPEHGI